MKEDLKIKLGWLLLSKAVKKNLPLLGIIEPAAAWKEIREIYKQDLGKLTEYGPGDVLKMNLAHAVMLGAVYKYCRKEPDVDQMTQFYHGIFADTPLLINAMKHIRMTDTKFRNVQKERAETSQKARHPYTWQFTVQDTDKDRFTAVFTRCGIKDYLSAQGMPEIIPAMCALDYAFADMSNHLFLRKHTLATGGSVCDCTYVNKQAAAETEHRQSAEDRRNEALRGGRTKDNNGKALL